MSLKSKIFRSIWRVCRPQPVIISRDRRGKISISLQALESLARKRIQNKKEIHRLAVTALPVAAGAGMHIRLTVLQNSTSSLARSVENAVRDEILKMTGLRLREVKIEISKKDT